MTAVDGEQAWGRLVAGNRRFVAGTPEHPRRDAARRDAQAARQTPFAVVLGCADSRVPPEIVFDEGIGDLFCIRVAGNTSHDDGVLGSIEYAAAVVECSLVVVLGHEECGAVKAAVDRVTTHAAVPGHILAVVQPLVPAVLAVLTDDEPDVVAAAVRENIRRQVQHLQTSTPVLADLVKGGKLKVIGAEYDLRTGAVERVS